MNLMTHYYASLFGMGLMIFIGVIQPFVLTSILKISLADQGRVTGTLGFYNELTLLLFIPIFGILSDKIGRRVVFAFGFLGVALATFLYSTAQSVAQLTVYRVIFALGASAISAMFATVIADYVVNRDRGKGTGFMGVSNGLGAMLAAVVLLGLPVFFTSRGYDYVTGLKLTFYVAVGLGIISAVVVFAGIKGGLIVAKHKQRGFVKLAAEGILAAKDPGILLAYLAAFVSRGDLALVGSFLILWLNKYGLENGLSEVDANKQAQLGFVIVQTTALIGAPIFGYLSDRVNRVRAVAIAVGLSAIGYSSLFLIENPLGGWMKLALLVVGLGEVAGVVASQTLIAQQAPKEIRGSVIGVFGFFGALGIMTAFTVGGYLFDHWTESAPFLLFGIFGTFVVAFALLVQKKVKPPERGEVMKTVVITGSTRGIGFGLADEFLKRDCKIVVSGRTQEACDKAVRKLGTTHDTSKILGVACDVTNYEQVQNLWDKSCDKFGNVDVWINNAGISNRYVKFWEVEPETVKNVSDVNVLGAMNGAHVALKGMIEQGGGQLYNMYGFGSDGRKGEGLTLYGSTKYGLKYLTESLSKEVKDTNVQVGSLSPGMVLTDLWDDLYEGMPERKEKSKKIVNILGDKVETVTPYLAEQVLETVKNGAKIAWLTTPVAIWRFATAAFNKRDLFEEEN